MSPAHQVEEDLKAIEKHWDNIYAKLLSRRFHSVEQYDDVMEPIRENISAMDKFTTHDKME